MKRNTRSILVAVVVVAALGWLVARMFCGAEGRTLPSEVCDNRVDDDNDGFVDCDDLHCFGNVACLGAGPDSRPPPGRSDPPDPPARDEPQLPSATDAGAEGPRPGSGGSCDPDAGGCRWECSRDEDCRLVHDFLDCCGGYPHRGGDDGDIEVCPGAAHRDRLSASLCVSPWSPGAPVPTVPARCTPYCTGVRCAPCTPPVRAVCHGGRCVPIVAGGCLTDAECSDGFACIDPDRDGRKECLAGEHECDTDAECVRSHPSCAGCRCLDGNEDQLRDCLCWECGAGHCSSDDECPAHHFCEDHGCRSFGDEACHLGGNLGECSACENCEPQNAENGSSRRGRCRPLGDGGVVADGGCVFR